MLKISPDVLLKLEYSHSHVLCCYFPLTILFSSSNFPKVIWGGGGDLLHFHFYRFSFIYLLHQILTTPSSATQCGMITVLTNLMRHEHF